MSDSDVTVEITVVSKAVEGEVIDKQEDIVIAGIETVQLLIEISKLGRDSIREEMKYLIDNLLDMKINRNSIVIKDSQSVAVVGLYKDLEEVKENIVKYIYCRCYWYRYDGTERTKYSDALEDKYKHRY